MLTTRIVSCGLRPLFMVMVRVRVRVRVSVRRSLHVWVRVMDPVCVEVYGWCG